MSEEHLQKLTEDWKAGVIHPPASTLQLEQRRYRVALGNCIRAYHNALVAIYYCNQKYSGWHEQKIQIAMTERKQTEARIKATYQARRAAILKQRQLLKEQANEAK